MEQIGDYTIQKKIGQGSLGAVFLAEHRFIKRPFAIKILPEDICSDSTFMRRFEAQVGEIAALDHPNIVKIHNVSFDQGVYFIVMDAIDERMSLERYLKEKTITEDDFYSILEQIASALDYVHNAGLFHGSLKLSNLWITPEKKVLLSDFAIARLVGEKATFLKICEQIAHSIGNESRAQFLQSFTFLAPEQKVGDEVTFKADAYAFGVLTYYLLTKKWPEGCFEMPSKMLETGQNWDLLISRCMQNTPNVRPQTLIGAMQEYLAAPKAILKEMLAVAEPKAEAVENPNQMAFEFLKPVLKPQEIARPEYESDPGAIFQRDASVSHYTPSKVEVKEIEPILTDMVVISGGTYHRGSNGGARDEMPRHPVRLAGFAIDVHPVTNEQFVRFLLTMGGEKDHNNNDIIRLRDSRIKRSAGKLVIESGYAKHPVVGVTWYGAVAYAKWVGKRLPTEAEWEAAASAGTEMLYPTGADIEKNQANFFSSDTTPVMSYPPNSFGLYEMAGNVYEWCQDWYAYNYYDSSSMEPDDPKGPLQGVYRVLRGGCWKSLKEDLRISHRHRNNPGAVNGTYGFRCAADVSQ